MFLTNNYSAHILKNVVEFRLYFSAPKDIQRSNVVF